MRCEGKAILTARRWALAAALAAIAVGVPAWRGPASTEAQTRPPVVLASVDVHQVKASRKSYAIIHPIAVYQNGQYRDGVIGAPELDKVHPRIPNSILHQVNAFTLFHRGDPIGMARVRKVAASADHTLHCMPSVAGFGVVEWKRQVSFAGAGESVLHVNARGDISPDAPGVERSGYVPVETRVRRFSAISRGPGPQAFFSRARVLTAAQRRLLARTARYQLNAEARRTWNSIGRVTPRGDLKLVSAELIDVDRDGAAEAVAVFNAPLLKPMPAATPGEPAPALEMLMVVRWPPRGKPSVLLSLPTLTGLGPEVSEGYGFDTALDIDEDGASELVLIHEYYYEDARYEIYRLAGGRFVRVFAGAVQGC